MFISIPKEFYVPVIFGDNYILNLDTQNMELDTECKRESTTKNLKNQGINKNSKAKDSGKIYVEIDDEYVNNMTMAKVSEKKTTVLKGNRSEQNENKYTEIDNEYIKEARPK